LKRLPIAFPLLLAALGWCCQAPCAEEGDLLRRLPPVEEPVVEIEAMASKTSGVPTPEIPQDAVVGTDAALDEPSALEQLEPESQWYGWLVPSVWRLPSTWEGSFELGMDGSEGNASTLTFRSGAKLRRKVDLSDLKVNLTYVRATAEQVETNHNAQLDANHDWLFEESPWSIFVKSILVYDEFRPFDLELTLNSGVGYRFVDNDVVLLKGRFGSGATRQWDGPDERWRPEAMLGVDFEYTVSEHQKFHITSEYFPEWGDFEVFRIRTDAGYEILVSEATNMSLKLGIIDRYDSNAGGTKPNALDYSVLLLWKL
jgi:putative salt-induced outer membrane protein YdiY